MIKMQLVCLCVVLLLWMYMKKSSYLNTRSALIYQGMLLFSLFNLVFDILTVYSVNHWLQSNPVLNRIFHICFIGTLQMHMAFLIHYIFLMVNRKFQRKRFRFMVIDVPLILSWLVLLSIPFDYTLNEHTNYASGTPVDVFYALISYYIVVALVILIRFGHKSKRIAESTIFSVLVIVTVLAIAQFIVPTLLLTSMAVMLVDLFIFLILENPEERFDRELNMFHEKALLTMLQEYEVTEKNYFIMMFAVTNIDQLKRQYSGVLSQKVLRYIRDYLFRTFKQNVFYLGSGSIVFFAPTRRKSVEWEQQIKNKFQSKMKLFGREICLEVEVKSLRIEAGSRRRPEDIFSEVEDYFYSLAAESTYKDHFTGVMNRNAYERDVVRYNSRLMEYETIWCSILDINHLKAVNDQYGHRYGDQLIQTCAKILLEVLPNQAKCYRIGGDEFALLFFSLTGREVNRIYQDLERLRIQMKINQNLEVSYSVGTVCFNGEMDRDLFDTLERADRKMYEQKEHMHREQKRGKNIDTFRKPNTTDNPTTCLYTDA